jgi:hypothetical protein
MIKSCIRVTLSQAQTTRHAFPTPTSDQILDLTVPFAGYYRDTLRGVSSWFNHVRDLALCISEDGFGSRSLHHFEVVVSTPGRNDRVFAVSSPLSEDAVAVITRKTAWLLTLSGIASAMSDPLEKGFEPYARDSQEMNLDEYTPCARCK